MALEALFRDRNVRNNIRTEIREAAEIGFGECDCCGKNASLLKAFNRTLCENCCNIIIDESYNYDHVFETFDEVEDISMMLSESFMTFDMAKINAAAQKFNGSIEELMKSYGMDIYKDLYKRLSDGQLYICLSDLGGGKSRVNQFIIDFDGSFTSARLPKILPDPDGTLAPVLIKGKPVGSTTTNNAPASGSKPASATSVPKQSSASVVQKVASPGPGLKASTNTGDTFGIKLTKDITLNCKRNGTTNGSDIGVDVSVNGDASFKAAMYVKDGDNDSLVKDIIEEIKKKPEAVFRAFTDDDMKDGYVINKYSAYAFKFDDKSFDGANISLVLTLNGKVFEKSRVPLPTYALFDRIKLDKALREFMDGRLKRFYPMLFNGTAVIKTSIGTAVTELVSVEASDKYKAGDVKVTTEIANMSIPWNCDGERFQDKELTHNTICDVIFSAFKKLIPGYDDPSIKSGVFAGSKTDSFAIENLDDNGMKYDMVATYDLNDLYDKGDIVFYMSVVDEHSGEEQPKSLQPVVYRKAGVPLYDFLARESKKIHAHYFKKSDMVDTLTASARDKMKNPSKKVALMSKICDNILSKLKFSDKHKWEDVSIELEDFDVNKEGKVTKATLRFYDSYGDSFDDSKEFAKDLKIESLPYLKFLKFKKADDSPRGMSEFGPSVIYTVTDTQGFSEFANLAILEELIFEAFGLTKVDESGRKMIYV